MLQWFVVVSKPNQEARAALELTNQNFRVYLPVLDCKPMFPRYLFVQFDRQLDAWGSIKNTRGCVELLCNGFIPSNVPTAIIEALMAYKSPEIIPASQSQFTKGQPVQITEGVLAGLEGLFQADVKGRTAVLLEIMGKRVEVPRNTVRAA